MNKKLIGGIVLGVILVTSVTFILIRVKDKEAKLKEDTKVVEIIKQNDTIVEKTKDVDVTINQYVVDIQQAVTMAHKMANSLITADEIWDNMDMNKENVGKLIELLGTVDDSANKDIILKIANTWKTGDFSNVDKDHDTIWDMIPDANVGISNGLNESKIMEAMKNMK